MATKYKNKKTGEIAEMAADDKRLIEAKDDWELYTEGSKPEGAGDGDGDGAGDGSGDGEGNSDGDGDTSNNNADDAVKPGEYKCDKCGETVPLKAGDAVKCPKCGDGTLAFQRDLADPDYNVPEKQYDVYL